MRSTLIKALLAGFAAGFLTWILCVSIGPLADWTQEFGACRGAEEIERDVQEGGTATSRGPGGGNSTTEVSTTTFELRCVFEDGEVKLVENDEAVLKGMAVGFGIGAVPVFLVVAGLGAFRTLRSGA